MAEITIKHGEKQHKIDARLHSQFIEMLGGCIYDGIWVGEDSEIPNIRGIRKDFVQIRLKEFKSAMPEDAHPEIVNDLYAAFVNA